MTHIARGVDENGVLQIDVVVNGEVPMLPPKAKIRVLPYTEDYIQTGPGATLNHSPISSQCIKEIGLLYM